MAKVRMWIAHVAGISLTLLLAGTTMLEAQGGKPRPRVGVPARDAAGPPAAQPQGSQVNPTIALAPGVLLACCVVEGVDPKTGNLLVKNTGSGQIQSVKVGPKAGTVGVTGSAATAAKYRPGQLVDMNVAKTAMVVTAFPVKAISGRKSTATAPGS